MPFVSGFKNFASDMDFMLGPRNAGLPSSSSFYPFPSWLVPGATGVAGGGRGCMLMDWSHWKFQAKFVGLKIPYNALQLYCFSGEILLAVIKTRQNTTFRISGT